MISATSMPPSQTSTWMESVIPLSGGDGRSLNKPAQKQVKS
jgi:hypothetical protein